MNANVEQVEHMSDEQIAVRLDADGYHYAARAGMAADIRAAARAGQLLWTRERLTATGPRRIDERPFAVSPAPEYEYEPEPLVDGARTGRPDWRERRAE